MGSETLGGVFVEGAGLVSNVGDGIKMAWEIGAAHRGECSSPAYYQDTET